MEFNELRKMGDAAQFQSFANSVINSLPDRIDADEN